MSFLEELEKGTYTENGALTNRSSLDSVLDFFAMAGAMRNNLSDARQLFRKAFAADNLAAVRTLFYLRDVRGGQGERNLFRELFRDLWSFDAQKANIALRFIPEYGRWDDVLAVASLDHVVGLVSAQLDKDNRALLNGENVSLLAKWLPSENASSNASREQARMLAHMLGMSNRQYRKMVSALRARIRLLEQDMSQGNWSEIDYSKLPSQAGRKHSKAFRRHDDARYSAFLDRAVRGEEKMNAGTLFTYEVMESIRSGQYQTANALWANLPDYTRGRNALVVADVSGSMLWGQGGTKPIDVSVSLALYFAERNKGPFNGYFMTFSLQPQLVKVQGKTLVDKVRNIEHADWEMNTNLEAVFDTVLEAARNARASQEELPAVIYIVSDMEFDASVSVNKTVFQAAKDNFARAGYVLPHIVFWNVSARNKQVPATKYDGNVSLFSGLSQSTFQHAIEGKTPVETMLDVLTSDRYARIVFE